MPPLHRSYFEIADFHIKYKIIKGVDFVSPAEVINIILGCHVKSSPQNCIVISADAGNDRVGGCKQAVQLVYKSQPRLFTLVHFIY